MITRQQIIEESAIKAPYEMGEGFIFAANNAEKLITQMRAMGSSGASPSKLAKETEQLTSAQNELEKIQKQLAAAHAKQTDEIIKQQRELIKDKEAIKQKIALGERDAKTVKAQSASIEQLKAALQANQKAYNRLTTEEERNSKTGQELLAIITEQKSEYDRLRKTSGQYTDAMGELRNELKAARGEMVSIAETLGQSSKEYQEAAKRAGEIADRIQDAKDEAKAFQGDTAIENLGTRFGMLTDKVRTLDFRGAGVQLQGIAEISRQMTFKEAIAGLSGFGSSLATLGRALLTNPLFWIAGALATAVVAFNYFSSQAEKASQKAIDRSKREMDALTERYDHEIRLMEIAGKQTFELQKIKQREIIRSADQAIKTSGDVTKFDLLQSILQRSYVRTVSDDKVSAIKEIYDSRKKAQRELEIIDAEEAAFTSKKQEETTKKIQEEIDKRIEAAIQADIRKADLEIQARIRQQQELDQTIKNLDTAKTWEEQVQESINAYGQEQTDKFLSMSELREKRLNEEITTSQALINDLSNVIINAAVDNDNFLKSLSKQFLIFSLNQIEKQLLAVQAETIAKATAQALAQHDSVATFGASGLARALIITGLIKAGFTIAKQQIARFEVGTQSAPGGLAFVGEAGTELIKTPSGRMVLSPDTATLANLPKGSKVFPHEETMRMIALNGLDGGNMMSSNEQNLLFLGQIFEKASDKSTAKIIDALGKNKPGNLYRQGSLVYEAQEDANRNRKLIRRSSLSR